MSEQNQITCEISDISNIVFDELSKDEIKSLGLDSSELRRIRFFAEHQDLADPIIYFLPEQQFGRRKPKKKVYIFGFD